MFLVNSTQINNEDPIKASFISSINKIGVKYFESINIIGTGVEKELER